jgi:hypothetical protein
MNRPAADLGRYHPPRRTFGPFGWGAWCALEVWSIPPVDPAPGAPASQFPIVPLDTVSGGKKVRLPELHVLRHPRQRCNRCVGPREIPWPW